MTRPLPAWPARLLHAAVADPMVAATISGDLHEEYLERHPRWWRDLAFTAACLAVAARYLPASLASAIRVDVVHAARSIARARTFAIASIGALALGIGTAATVLTIAYASLLRPLPLDRSEQLVRWGQTPIANPVGINSTAIANFLDMEARTTAFAGLAASQLSRVNVTSDAGAESVLMAIVTPNYLDVLGVRPLLGRGFVASDAEPGAPPVAIITDAVWRRTFGAAADIVGRTIRVDASPRVVVGVVASNLGVPGDPSLWAPFQWDAAARQTRDRRNIEPIGRLREGISFDAGRQELQALFADLAAAYPAVNGKSTIAAMSYRDFALGGSSPGRGLMPLIASAAGVLLLIAYLNVANLTIGRREARRHEHALRQVLGASAWRQFVHRMAEASLVVVPAAMLAMLMAFWAVPAIVSRFGDAIPRATTIAPGLVTAVVVALASLVAALVTAIAGGRLRSRWVTPAMLGRRTSTGAFRTRRRLVAVQVGLAAGLVYGAVLLGATLAALVRTDLGVPIEGALTFAVGLSDRYSDPSRVRGYFDELSSRIAQLPRVTAVGATSRTPFSGGTNGEASAADDPARVEPIAEYRTVMPHLFEALGLRIVEGRGYAGVPLSAARQIIVSEALARKLFPGGPAVGRRVRLGSDADIYEVLGVVSDLRDFGPTRPSRPAIYLRHGSEPGFASARAMVFVVRAGGVLDALVPDIRRIVRDLDADVAVERVATLEELATRSLGSSRRAATTVVVSLAAIALALGVIGVFGVVADGVERRTREIGVRLAIGDTPSGIVRLFLNDGIRLAIAGAVLGAGVAWFVDGLVRSVVVQTAAPGAIATIAMALAILGASTLIASALPARRAGRLEPVQALREE
ncbi:MAG TPA: ABC transporter permease [Vicinamibacterales bacterium]|nr:ABC transporter permease [Vicinamibacterales bacterium]